MKKISVFLIIMITMLVVINCAAANSVGDNFYMDRASFEVDGKYGFIDRTGKIVLPAQWDSVIGFLKGDPVHAVVVKNDEYAIIDVDGNIIFDYRKCSAINAFDDRFFFVRYENDDDAYVEVYTYDGKLINPEKWIRATRSDESDILYVQNDSGLWGYYDANSGYIIPCQYESAGVFVDGLAAVRSKNAKGKLVDSYINLQGETVITGDWDYAATFSEDGYAMVFKGELTDAGSPSKGKYAFIDTQGHLICDYIWDDAFLFDDGFARVASIDAKGRKTWGFLNADGKILNDQYWDEIRPFENGAALVVKDDKYGFIDESGSFISDLQWDGASSMHNGIAIVAKKDDNGDISVGAINDKGEIIVDLVWEDMEYFYEGLATVRKDGKYGSVNEKGEIVVPVKWYKRYVFNEGVAIVWERDSWYIIDSEGNVIF